jgi:hypothetical protein
MGEIRERAANTIVCQKISVVDPYAHKIERGYPDPHPDPHQSDKLDPDPYPYQFADNKPKCMEYEPI